MSVGKPLPPFSKLSGGMIQYGLFWNLCETTGPSTRYGLVLVACRPAMQHVWTEPSWVVDGRVLTYDEPCRISAFKVKCPAFDTKHAVMMPPTFQKP